MYGTKRLLYVATAAAAAVTMSSYSVVVPQWWGTGTPKTTTILPVVVSFQTSYSQSTRPKQRFGDSSSSSNSRSSFTGYRNSNRRRTTTTTTTITTTSTKHVQQQQQQYTPTPLILDTLDFSSIYNSNDATATNTIILPHIQELSNQWLLEYQHQQPKEYPDTESLTGTTMTTNIATLSRTVEEEQQQVNSLLHDNTDTNKSSPQQQQEQQQEQQLQQKDAIETSRSTLKHQQQQPQHRQQKRQSSMEGGDLICRVITRSDRKLPYYYDTTIHHHHPNSRRHTGSSAALLQRQLEDIYHAKVHQEIRQLPYITSSQQQQQQQQNSAMEETKEKLVSTTTTTTIRQSLEDAGYELLSRRDLDLCEALNAGYLLRLSILPDVKKLDPMMVLEMYPEKFDSNTGHVLPEYVNDFLFDQRVLVYWRGYSKEVTRGRLLLPKLDYLQASLVQRLFGNVRTQLTRLEQFLVINALATYRNATACFLYYMRLATEHVPNEDLSKRLRKMIRSPYFYSPFKALNHGKLPSVTEMKQKAANRKNTFITLSRYGGTKTKFVGSPNPRDALNPFIICEEKMDGTSTCSSGDCSEINCVDNDDIKTLSTTATTDGIEQSSSSPSSSSQITRVQRVNERMYESLNSNEIRCPYDKSVSSETLPPMQLLERVSISNLVDIFTTEGRRSLFQTIFSKSELVEPTYEEVVVVWRPVHEEEEKFVSTDPKFVPPKFLYDLAKKLDVQGLPPIPKKEPEVSKRPSPPIEIRTFEGVPMANLPAVLPKTKLIFRPADAFVFDLISILSFVAIIGSIRFDNPKLDILAIVSVGLWLIRTLLRYSNKLARYDLLVKKFLTSKITHRNIGALKYIMNEAGLQRSIRATLMHMWLTDDKNNNSNNERQGLFGGGPLLLRSQLIANAQKDIQNMIESKKRISINVDAALADLEDLNLVRRLDKSGQLLEVTRDDVSIEQTLKRKWVSLFTSRSRNEHNNNNKESSDHAFAETSSTNNRL